MSSIQLWPEQKKVFKFAREREAAALFCEQRTGKTYVTLKLIEDLLKPSDEVNDFCGLLVTLLTNRDSTWLKGLRTFLPQVNVTSDWEVFKKLPAPRILLIHYEDFVKLINRLCKYKKFNWSCFDEAQRIANRGTASSRGASRVSWINRRLILTGTPQETHEVDYFGLMRYLKPDMFGKNFDNFENHYFEWHKLESLKRVKPGTPQHRELILKQKMIKKQNIKFRENRRKKFTNKLKAVSIRLTKEDAGILPAEVHRIHVPMNSEQRRVYQELQDQSVTRIGNTRIMAPLKVTGIAKLRTVASGFIYDDDRKVHHLSRRKLDKTLDLIQQLPKPVVIFTAFRPDNQLVYKAVKKKGYKVAQVHGSTKKKLRPQIWQNFQDGKYDVIVVQVKTGGTGVDLWRSSHAIVYSMSHSFRDWDQSKSRLDNRDKKSASKFFVLCSEKSIDDSLYDLVIDKALKTERVLSTLKHDIGKRRQSWLPRKTPTTRPTASKSCSKRLASSRRPFVLRFARSALRKPTPAATAGTRRKTSTLS